MQNAELLKVLKVGSTVKVKTEGTQRLCIVEALKLDDEKPLKLKDMNTHELVECMADDVVQVMTDVGEVTPKQAAQDLKDKSE